LTSTDRKSISYFRKKTDKQNKSVDEIDRYVFEPFQSINHNIISREEVDSIINVFEKLPQKCNDVFFLAKIEGLLYLEIAEKLNISGKRD